MGTPPIIFLFLFSGSFLLHFFSKKWKAFLLTFFSKKVSYLIFNRLEVLGTVQTPRTFEVCGESFALVNVAAYLADVAFYFLCGGWLYVSKIVFVGHALFVTQHFSFGDLCNKHHMCAAVNGLADLGTDKGVGVLGEAESAVLRSAGIGKILKLIFISAAYKSKAFKNREGRAFGQHADVEHSRVHYHFAGKILFVYGYAYLFGRIRHLHSGVDNAAVILAVLMGSENEQAVGKLEHSGVIDITHISSPFEVNFMSLSIL